MHRGPHVSQLSNRLTDRHRRLAPAPIQGGAWRPLCEPSEWSGATSLARKRPLHGQNDFRKVSTPRIETPRCHYPILSFHFVFGCADCAGVEFKALSAARICQCPHVAETMQANR